MNNDPNGALGGQASASIGDLKFNGGDGGTGSGTASGGGGGAAGETDNGGSGSAPTAGIGISPGGNGGAGRSGSQGNGTAGSAYGGGGGGAYRTSSSNRSGGNGAIGAVFVTYIIPSCAGEPDVTTVDNVEICPGFSTEIGITGLSLAEGYTYQWKYSSEIDGIYEIATGISTNTTIILQQHFLQILHITNAKLVVRIVV